MPRKTVDGRTVYLCHNDFGPPSLQGMYPRITDFGLAQRGDQPGPLVFPIQPDQYQAPEVLLGTGWSYPADIWNFAAMIYELLAGKELFQTVAKKNKVPYSAAQHVAEMIQLLGPVPPALLQKERIMRQMRWSPEIRNGEGKLCNNIADFFGGPFFTDEGTLRVPKI
jgi:serine/threonine-protein kinase SRPK3